MGRQSRLEGTAGISFYRPIVSAAAGVILAAGALGLAVRGTYYGRYACLPVAPHAHSANWGGEGSGRVIVDVAMPKQGANRGGPVYRIRGRRVDRKELIDTLFRYAEIRRDFTCRSEPSEVAVLIRCDRDLPFGAVQEVFRACMNPDVRIYKIRFAVIESRH